MNCSFITHLTPATLITLRSTTAAIPIPLMAHLESPAPINCAIDSPKPNTFRAQPTAYNFGKNKISEAVWKKVNMNIGINVYIPDQNNK